MILARFCLPSFNGKHLGIYSTPISTVYHCIVFYYFFQISKIAKKDVLKKLEELEASEVNEGAENEEGEEGDAEEGDGEEKENEEIVSETEEVCFYNKC